jgi:hypothetical protein
MQRSDQKPWNEFPDIEGVNVPKEISLSGVCLLQDNGFQIT